MGVVVSRPGLEAPAVGAGLDDVAVVGEATEQRRGHRGVAEDAGPFAEGKVGGDDDRGALVELAAQVEEELAASAHAGGGATSGELARCLREGPHGWE
jgi:hypothetical protein